MEVYRQISALLMPAWKPLRESSEDMPGPRGSAAAISTLFGWCIGRSPCFCSIAPLLLTCSGQRRRICCCLEYQICEVETEGTAL